MCYNSKNMTKDQKLEYIFDAIKKAYPNRKLVFKDGSSDASLMLIGEAPGVNEEKEGRPFVGRGGQLMNTTLESLGWQRSDFYVSNIVKYRPQDPTGKTLTPTDREIDIFRPSIEKEIQVIDPKAIVVIGRIAMMGLGIEGTMSANHGRTFEKNGRKILVAYHPAAVLRNINLEPLFREDLAKIRGMLV